MKTALKRARFRGRVSAVDVRRVQEFYLNRSYCFLLIRNSLMDIVMRLSVELNQMQRFKRIARDSFDFEEYICISDVETALLEKIKGVF